MPKDDLLYLGHMLDTARTALRLVAGKTRQDYDQDEVLRLALAHLAQVIGEAARRVSQEFCDAHPEIPWKAIVGMRHKVVHDYMDLDEEVVWDTVANELPALVKMLQEVVPSYCGGRCFGTPKEIEIPADTHSGSWLMKKKIAIAAGILLGLMAVAGLCFWYFMGKPLYEPGMVRSGKNLRASLNPPEQSGEASFWTVEKDIKLFHFSEGTEKDVLVIHGGPGYPIQNPLPGLKPLTTSYKFIYYHQRGCGKSTRPIDKFSSSNYYENVKTLDGTLGLGAQIADIERIRRIIGDEKLIIVGHSFGGFLGSLYAAEFPERVKALILVAPATLLVMPVEGGGLFEEIKPLLPGSMKREYEAFLRAYLDFSRIFSKSDADLAALNAKFAKYYRAAAQARKISIPEETEPGENGGWMVWAMYFSIGRRHDYRPALKKVSAPVLVLHGEKDLQSEKASRSYADCFPHSTFQVINNAGHFIFNDQPEEFAAVTSKFLSGVN